MAAAARPEVGFYQLSRWPLERALPRLLERARDQDLRCLVRCGSRARLDHLDGRLNFNASMFRVRWCHDLFALSIQLPIFVAGKERHG